MKYVNYLKETEHVLVYPLVVLILFASLFLFILIRTFAANREEMRDFSHLPLDTDAHQLPAEKGKDTNTPLI